MEKIVLIVHVLTALAIIAMILLQQGKGAEAGASFGSGASQTVFGSSGSWNFFSKVTAILATVFFVTSFGLAVIARDNSGVSGALLPALETVQSEIGSMGDIPLSDTILDAADDIDEIPMFEELIEQAAGDLESEIPAVE